MVLQIALLSIALYFCANALFNLYDYIRFRNLHNLTGFFTSTLGAILYWALFEILKRL
jgi:hypothetical protein